MGFYFFKGDDSLKDMMDSIRAEVTAGLAAAATSADVEALRVKALGRKGSITALLREMGKVSSEERPKLGLVINGLRDELEAAITAKETDLARAEREEALRRDAVDVTQPAPALRFGSLHPLSQTAERMLDVFIAMGFEVVEGPEVELDHYNFELLNIPKNHPARDMQDTFYINENVVLRTHTSPMQARVMEKQKPPIRIVCPGRVYRAEQVDATHGYVFHQMECLVVDEGIHMGHLKGTLDEFVRAMYGEYATTRLRPSFFPFTEPSAEVDVTCAECKGKGCRVCKGTGWIEILGSGMVNPRVLELCGIDSTKYSGFAFGVGIDRVADLRHKIPDMRLLMENDLRFLSQFR